MPRRKLQTRPRAWPRVVILGLVGIAAAACSDSARFDSYNADRPVPPHNVTSPVSGRPAGRHSVVAAHPPTPPSKTAQPQTVKPEKVVSLPAVQNAPVAKEEPRTTETVVKAAEPSGAMPSFGWPVRGRLIAGFGSKPDGTQNDGINLAVPEGTPIKAADDGVVVYAGNELKGYGNLVLIQHTNGFVTAYAHASELMVKRGDTVKRGQVIAHAGQTGNVTSPQLHFEIRKGSTPVDPTQYLGGA
jgi:murein DD-endopeptidase MepM/ murein hydrolase activator NlpD